MAEKNKDVKQKKELSGYTDCGGIKPQKLLTPKDVKKRKESEKK